MSAWGERALDEDPAGDALAAERLADVLLPLYALVVGFDVVLGAVAGLAVVPPLVFLATDLRGGALLQLLAFAGVTGVCALLAATGLALTALWRSATREALALELAVAAALALPALPLATVVAVWVEVVCVALGVPTFVTPLASPGPATVLTSYLGATLGIVAARRARAAG